MIGNAEAFYQALGFPYRCGPQTRLTRQCVVGGASTVVTAPVFVVHPSPGGCRCPRLLTNHVPLASLHHTLRVVNIVSGALNDAAAKKCAGLGGGGRSYLLS